MKRRDFLKASAVATAFAGFPLAHVACTKQNGGTMSESNSLSSIGVQLYTVRTLMENDFEGTIRKVAALGYKEVEFAGYYDNPHGDVRALLDELGLSAPAVHVGIADLRKDRDKWIEAARVMGHKYMIIPWLGNDERDTLDKLKGLATEFNGLGEACKAAGIRLAYHNHDFEFAPVEGQLMYDVLLNNTDTSLVDMELDLYWIKKAGKEPLAYFDSHPGRFKACHVKDMLSDGSMAAVGQGQIDFAAIFAASKKAGLEHYFVEHDRPDDPMVSIETSIGYLKNLTWEGARKT
jgi:sugar phosphate isomerase/epimerase